MWFSVIQTQFEFQFYILIGDQAEMDKEWERLEERGYFSFFLTEHVINIMKLHVALSVNLFSCWSASSECKQMREI